MTLPGTAEDGAGIFSSTEAWSGLEFELNAKSSPSVRFMAYGKSEGEVWRAGIGTYVKLHVSGFSSPKIREEIMEAWKPSDDEFGSFKEHNSIWQRIRRVHRDGLLWLRIFTRAGVNISSPNRRAERHDSINNLSNFQRILECKSYTLQLEASGVDDQSLSGLSP